MFSDLGVREAFGRHDQFLTLAFGQHVELCTVDR